jgi:hypothetical protein
LISICGRQNAEARVSLGSCPSGRPLPYSPRPCSLSAVCIDGVSNALSCFDAVLRRLECGGVESSLKLRRPRLHPVGPFRTDGAHALVCDAAEFEGTQRSWARRPQPVILKSWHRNLKPRHIIRTGRTCNRLTEPRAHGGLVAACVDGSSTRRAEPFRSFFTVYSNCAGAERGGAEAAKALALAKQPQPSGRQPCAAATQPPQQPPRHHSPSPHAPPSSTPAPHARTDAAPPVPVPVPLLAKPLRPPSAHARAPAPAVGRRAADLVPP